jgi:hypothetical protein
MSVINATPLLAAAGGDYQISRSVRLRSSASAYFNRTPGTAGNRKTWTWSGWVKRGVLGTTQFVFSTYGSATDTTSLSLFFNASDQLCLGTQVTDYRISSAVYRDPSAWYHVIAVLDANNGTTQSRMRLWVNGSEITAWATNTSAPTQDFGINLAQEHRIGSRPVTNNLFVDGYLTEVNFIDGQALTPSSFGETDVLTGVWKPKKYAGTYGTNGFFLNFADNSAATAAAIGKDSSGNGNNWTPNNISVTAGATYDSMLDVPTLYADGGNGRGNYATLNPLNSFSTSVAPNEGNLRYRSDSSAWRSATSTLSMRQGKWYAEFSCSFIATGSAMAPGIVPSTASFIGTTNTANTLGYGYFNDGDTYALGTASASGTTYATNDVIGIAFDADAGKLWFSKNGVWIASGDPATGANARYSGITGEWCFALGSFVSHAQTASFANFGQRPFAYTPPTGFKALNTQNLPEPTIKKGNQWFDVSLYTGTGSTLAVTNSGSMQPDFVWLKARSSAFQHGLFDAVRGTGKGLVSNTTDAEATFSAVTSFNSNGFTNGTDYNNSGTTYVGWQWKESVSAGFDIVTYTGTGSARTVAHSLGVAPKMVIVKNRTTATGGGNWPVYHANQNASPASGATFLNLTNAFGTAAQIWNSTAPSSSAISLGTSAETNFNGATYVAYLFAEVAGFSKFGSYTGNGSSTDGPFVFCGFRPRFVMVKRTDIAGDGWTILDTSRNTYNVANAKIEANASTAESASYNVMDVLSNGFKLRDADRSWNGNGGTYIFAAFAEVPFKSALGR